MRFMPGQDSARRRREFGIAARKLRHHPAQLSKVGTVRRVRVMLGGSIKESPHLRCIRIRLPIGDIACKPCQTIVTTQKDWTFIRMFKDRVSIRQPRQSACMHQG